MSAGGAAFEPGLAPCMQGHARVASLLERAAEEVDGCGFDLHTGPGIPLDPAALEGGLPCSSHGDALFLARGEPAVAEPGRGRLHPQASQAVAAHLAAFEGGHGALEEGDPVAPVAGNPRTLEVQGGPGLAVNTGTEVAADLALDEFQRPKTFFTAFTQTGCTRVQFYTYKQDPPKFGEGMRTGCLFYEFGCRGPMTHSPCNRILWNRQSSKTRAGHPCTGCTEPGFPFGDLEKGTVFKTQKISGSVPKEVPAGTDHVTYMAHAAAARIAAPQWSKEDMFVV